MPDGDQTIGDDAPAPIVTPRVRTSPASGALALSKVVEGYLAANVRGVVELRAPAGGGKTCALAALRQRFPDAHQLLLLDEPTADVLQASPEDGLTIASSVYPVDGAIASLVLATWDKDEWLEYLAKKHPNVCRTVLCRLRQAIDTPALAGCPALWAAALESMAGDESITSVVEALRAHLHVSLSSDQREHAEGIAFWKADRKESELDRFATGFALRQAATLSRRAADPRDGPILCPRRRSRADRWSADGASASGPGHAHRASAT